MFQFTEIDFVFQIELSSVISTDSRTPIVQDGNTLTVHDSLFLTDWVVAWNGSGELLTGVFFSFQSLIIDHQTRATQMIDHTTRNTNFFRSFFMAESV